MVTMDSDGERVKLGCVNWYSAHMEDMVVNGEWVIMWSMLPTNGVLTRDNTWLHGIIAGLGFNCVRLPWALDMLFENSVTLCCGQEGEIVSQH